MKRDDLDQNRGGPTDRACSLKIPVRGKKEYNTQIVIRFGPFSNVYGQFHDSNSNGKLHMYPLIQYHIYLSELIRG